MTEFKEIYEVPAMVLLNIKYSVLEGSNSIDNADEDNYNLG